MEFIIVGALVIFVLIYTKRFSPNKFIEDNDYLIKMLKEDDYEFLLHAKYGEDVDVDKLFQKRINMGFIVIALALFAFLGNLSLLNIVIAIALGYLVFKSQYSSLKSYYKKHLHDIDIMLPYYLKSLEILVQHYTVPVAIAKSIDDAPDIFKPGLREMIAKIDSGDSSIQPYMDFAVQYPVRDSMRMMRLLYRLGLGSQEKKQERLLMFSRTVSSLQNKARAQKYQERLHKMESQTMVMLVATGAGVMVLILMAMMMMFQGL